jgi:hypothetical protein
LFLLLLLLQSPQRLVLQAPSPHVLPPRPVSAGRQLQPAPRLAALQRLLGRLQPRRSLVLDEKPFPAHPALYQEQQLAVPLGRRRQLLSYCSLPPRPLVLHLRRSQVPPQLPQNVQQHPRRLPLVVLPLQPRLPLLLPSRVQVTPEAMPTRKLPRKPQLLVGRSLLHQPLGALLSASLVSRSTPTTAARSQLSLIPLRRPRAALRRSTSCLMCLVGRKATRLLPLLLPLHSAPLVTRGALPLRSTSRRRSSRRLELCQALPLLLSQWEMATTAPALSQDSLPPLYQCAA